MYAVGDKILHPKHGAGEIREILETEQGTYYLFQMPMGTMTVNIPAESAEKIGVRDIVDSVTADRLLALLQETVEDPESNWNKRFRDNADKVKSGNPEDVIFVLKSLAHREQTKGLSTGERKLMHAAMQIFSSEYALAKSISYREAEAEICALIGRKPRRLS